MKSHTISLLILVLTTMAGAQSTAQPPVIVYTGDFIATKFDSKRRYTPVNRISIRVDVLEEGRFLGSNVVAGTSRPLTGTAKKSGNAYKVEAREPGDDRYDGVFTFTIKPDTGVITGKWIPNDKKLTVTERSYELKKTGFVYNPNAALPDLSGYELKGANGETGTEEYLTEAFSGINASSTLLKAADIENLPKGDLEILRNSVYARHGLSFKSRRIRDVFETKVPWYIPVATDVSKELTQTEQKNIRLIQRYEEHAATYYESYGR